MKVNQLTNEINIQKWSKLIEECRNSNTTVVKWCRENGIKKQQYYYWQKKICNSLCESLPKVKKLESPANFPSFAEIKLPTQNTSTDIALSISINNISIQVHNNANEKTIAAALKIINTL